MRTTVVLHGPRRYGKTSLLKQLPARLGPDVLPVFVDLQSGLGGAESAATLLAGLAAEITTQAADVRGMDGLPAAAHDDFAHEPYVAFGRWLDAVEDALGERHVLLCLDEFEQLQTQIDEGRLDRRILDLLRSIVQHRRRLTVALTGVNALGELAPRWAATLVSATAIELGALGREDARELVRRPVPGFPDVYTEAAVDAILAVTARQPYLLQVLCSVVVEALNARRWRPGAPPADVGDVEDALAPAVQRAENYFHDVWHNQVPDDACELVRDLARRPDGGMTTAAVVHDGLAEAVLALERRRIVARSAAGLTLEVPLFGEYVRTKQSLP